MAALIAAAVFCGYSASSFILLRYPTLLHKRKKVVFQTHHISHRGGAAERLENTMAAFHHCVSLRTDMIELDCQLTKDGVVVISHDNNLSRVCGVDTSISQLNFSELPPMKPELWLHFHRSHVCVQAEDSDRQIPSLRQVFETFPATPINVDPKLESDELLLKIHELIKEFRREHITVWGTKSDPVARKLYKMDPTVGLAFSLPRVIWLLAAYWTGLLPFLPVKETYLEVVMPSIILKLTDDSIEDNIQRIAERPFSRGWKDRLFKLFVRLFDFLLMSPGLFAHLDRRGIKVLLWVINEEEDWERAYAVGAHGIMTDFPTPYREWLDRNHMCLEPHERAAHLRQRKRGGGQTAPLVAK